MRRCPPAGRSSCLSDRWNWIIAATLSTSWSSTFGNDWYKRIGSTVANIRLSPDFTMGQSVAGKWHGAEVQSGRNDGRPHCNSICRAKEVNALQSLTWSLLYNYCGLVHDGWTDGGETTILAASIEIDFILTFCFCRSDKKFRESRRRRRKLTDQRNCCGWSSSRFIAPLYLLAFSVLVAPVKQVGMSRESLRSQLQNGLGSNRRGRTGRRWIFSFVWWNHRFTFDMWTPSQLTRRVIIFFLFPSFPKCGHWVGYVSFISFPRCSK